MFTFIHPGRLRPRWGLAIITATAAGLSPAAPARDDAPVHGKTGHSEQGFIPGVIVDPNLDLYLLVPQEASAGFEQSLYVAMGDVTLLVTLNERGEIIPLADLGMISLPPLPWSFSIDRLGGYRGSLYLNDDRNRVYEITLAGEVSLFVANGAGGVRNTAIELDRYGAFAGRLFLTDTRGSLRRVDPDGRVALFATGLAGAEHFLAFSPGGAYGDHLYVADAAARRILRITPRHVPGDPAPVWVDLRKIDPHFVPRRLEFDDAGRSGRVMHVHGARAGEVIDLAADGTPVSESESGFEEPAPWSKVGDLLRLLMQWGPCADCLECPADLDFDCFVGPDDLEALLATSPDRVIAEKEGSTRDLTTDAIQSRRAEPPRGGGPRRP